MAITDKLNETYNGVKPVVTTLSAQKVQGAGSCTIQDATGWPTDTAVHFIMFKLKADGVTKDESTQTEWKGTLSGTTISNLTLTAGTDILYPATTTKVAVAPTAKWAQELIEAVQGVITQAGALAANAVGTTQIQSGAVTSAKIDSSVTSSIKSSLQADSNFRTKQRVSISTSTATLTPNIDNASIYELSAQAASLSIANPTGTPNEKDVMMFFIKDNGTTRSISWGSAYVNISGLDTLTATVANKWHVVGCSYNATLSKWQIVSISTEA